MSIYATPDDSRSNPFLALLVMVHRSAQAAIAFELRHPDCEPAKGTSLVISPLLLVDANSRPCAMCNEGPFVASTVVATRAQSRF